MSDFETLISTRSILVMYQNFTWIHESDHYHHRKILRSKHASGDSIQNPLQNQKNKTKQTNCLLNFQSNIFLAILLTWQQSKKQTIRFFLRKAEKHSQTNL